MPCFSSTAPFDSCPYFLEGCLSRSYDVFDCMNLRLIIGLHFSRMKDLNECSNRDLNVMHRVKLNLIIVILDRRRP